MELNPGATYREILEQPQVWAEAVQEVEAKRSQIESLPLASYEQVIFAGCGSTYYLSLSAAARFQSIHHKISRAFPSSEIFTNPDLIYGEPGRRILLVALSRSGTTSETLHAVQQFQSRAEGEVVVLTNEPDSPLAAMANLYLAVPGGREESVAQTKSFASMWVASAGLALASARQDDLLDRLAELPAFGKRILSDYEAAARELAEDPEVHQFFFLGSGERYGLACEASLKMKEMSLTVSEPFHFMEFRHGPVSMVDPHTTVVGLLSDQNRAPELAVLQDIQRLGGRTFTLGESGADIEFRSGMPEAVRGVLYLPVLQLLACYRAAHAGLNPDRPRNLTAVVKLNFQ